MDFINRANERAAKENPSNIEARIKELRSLVRSGKLSQWHVKTAAYCFDDAAKNLCRPEIICRYELLDEICHCGDCTLYNEGFDGWFRRLGVWGQIIDTIENNSFVTDQSNAVTRNKLVLCAIIAAAKVVLDKKDTAACQTGKMSDHLVVRGIKRIIDAAEAWLKDPCQVLLVDWNSAIKTFESNSDLDYENRFKSPWIPKPSNDDLFADWTNTTDVNPLFLGDPEHDPDGHIFRRIPDFLCPTYLRIRATINISGDKELIQNACFNACARWVLTPKH